MAWMALVLSRRHMRYDTHFTTKSVTDISSRGKSRTHADSFLTPTQWSVSLALKSSFTTSGPVPTLK